MKTKEEFFNFSYGKQKFFDNYYRRHGWPFKRIMGEENKKYDCVVKRNGIWIKIEEKARFDNAGHDDFLVELIQDIDSNNPGWFFTSEADYIFYLTPQETLYIVDLKKLQKILPISTKGWGKTLNIVIPWRLLIDEYKIAWKRTETNTGANGPC